MAETVKHVGKDPYRGPRTGGDQYKSKKPKDAKKHKGRPRPGPVRRGEPAFLYYVHGTDIRATKTPCERNPEATRDRPSQSPLGTWKNPLTGKKCKVTRVRNVRPEVEEEYESASNA